MIFFNIQPLKTIKKRYVTLIVFAALYVIGILSGIIFNSDNFFWCGFYDKICSFCYRILDPSQSVWEIFFSRIINDFGYVLIIGALSLTIYTYPATFAVITFRGVVLGGAIRTFLSAYGSGGVAIATFIVFPQNLIVTSGLCLLAELATDYVRSLNSCRKFSFSIYIGICLVGLAVCALGAVLELIILALLVRPLYFYF